MLLDFSELSDTNEMNKRCGDKTKAHRRKKEKRIGRGCQWVSSNLNNCATNINLAPLAIVGDGSAAAGGSRARAPRVK
ncbi:hypothetical protein KQX54_008659 [Cotesia glomerata]|uniref:Uncharacterized protein n=1 Tax=Cotesia glomerata TaxID=32391 RepID=A0AAV7HQC7_COTGL|nr:hypothetical protein KQX54_008659 [Cotesia glomerata]